MAARTTVVCALLAAVLALAIGACEAFGPERSGKFTIVAPADGFVDQLVADVVDRTGTVAAIGISRDQLPDGVVADQPTLRSSS